ncbi:MAG: hypothetical protein ACLQU1_01290 [Bryobacteraceae bacterium]
MRYVALLLTAGLMAQAPMLNIVVVEGEGAINNIRQRTAREPIVEVQDDNHRPVAGAVVVFTLPTQGAGGEFSGGAHTLTVITDDQGRAVAHGFRPNGVKGQFQIHVNASLNGRTGSININQGNVAGGGSAAHAGVSGKLIAILVVVAAAAAAGGAWAATHSGGGSTTQPPATTTITAGGGTVGPAITPRGR